MSAELEASDTDVIAASPYHPDGAVEGVPAWRLVLSRGASHLYGWILKADLYSYTACFRAFRRDAVARLEFQQPGFLGVTEMLVNGILDGMQVVERPMTLRCRVTGISKMNTLRVIVDHLGFMARLLLRRRAGRSGMVKRRLVKRGVGKSGKAERLGTVRSSKSA